MLNRLARAVAFRVTGRGKNAMSAVPGVCLDSEHGCDRTNHPQLGHALCTRSGMTYERLTNSDRRISSLFGTCSSGDNQLGEF